MNRAAAIWGGALVLLVAGLAIPVVLWLEARPSAARFGELRDEGRRLIMRCAAVPPPGVSKTTWENVVVPVYNTWGNAVYAAEDVSLNELDQTVGRLKESLSDVQPENVTRRLERVFDELEQLVPQRSPLIQEMHNSYQSDLRSIAVTAKDG